MIEGTTKISSDFTGFFKNFFFPLLTTVLAVFSISAYINGILLFAIFSAIMASFGLLLCLINPYKQVSEVWIHPQKRVFLIETGRKENLEMDFESLNGFRTNRRGILELSFKGKIKVTFLLSTTFENPPKNEVLNFLNELLSR
jgi:hypothetical protein